MSTTRRQRRTTQQQQVQIEEPRPLELPPAEHVRVLVRQDATLEEMLEYPELIFNRLINPIIRQYVYLRQRDRTLQIDETQLII